MTAEELIERLKSLPAETPVLVGGYETGYDDIADLKPLEVIRYRNAQDWDGKYQASEKFSNTENSAFSAALIFGRRGHLRKVQVPNVTTVEAMEELDADQGQRFSLNELIAQCDPDAPMPKELQDWENAKPVGLEYEPISFVGRPQYYLSGASALSLPPEDGRPPALWYSSSLSNPEYWQVAGKHLTHTGSLIGVAGLWDATSAIARYGVTVPRIWAASPERAVFDLLIDHCEVDESTVPNIQATDIDDVVNLKQVIQWVELCKGFLSQAGRVRIQDWLEGGYR